MRTLSLLWLFISTSLAGEISQRYFAELKQDTNAPNRTLAHKQGWRGITLTNASGQLEMSHGPINIKHGVTEIGIERTQCYGTCPDYTFVVSANGRCRYEGGKFAKVQGRRTGQASVIICHRIAEFSRELSFFALENEYDPTVTDNPTTFTTMVMNGKRKTIRNYAEGGPTRLLALELLIDQMLADVQWDK